MATSISSRGRLSTGGFDPLRAVFRLLTSIRFAILQLALVALAALLGVVFPQAPAAVRLNPVAFDDWTEGHRGRYGPFTDLMRQLDLFEVFRSYWFNGLFTLLLVSVAVCTVNRFAPIWRSVRRPVLRPNDRYFETAHHRAAFETPADPSSIDAVLRRRRFAVRTVAETDGTRYLFADRFAWAQLATFATHLSLILFMAGGIVSKLAGFETMLQVGEGGTQPVFPVLHERQMQVENLDSIERRDAEGRVIDYRTALVVYQDGRPACEAEITVNGPLNCRGYRFHQGTYSGNGVGIQVKDRRTGQVIFSEAAILSDAPGTPNPRLVVRDGAGATVLDDYLTLAPISGDAFAQLFPLTEGGPAYGFSVVTGADADGRLAVARLPDPRVPGDAGVRLSLAPGESGQGDGYTFELVEMRANAWDVIQGIPGIERAALLQLSRDRAGADYLDVVNMGGGGSGAGRFQLAPGESHVAGDFEYTFTGRREFTGVLVRRDPGSWIIWVATALLVGGLMVTFYAPRRRLWLRIRPDRTVVAGLGDRTGDLREELEQLGRALEQGPRRT